MVLGLNLKNNDMTLNNALEVLVKYSKWRKGENARTPSPQEVGVAIDTVVDHLALKKRKSDNKTRTRL
jgi:hypothetical protein